jgi:hypothetical protein
MPLIAQGNVKPGARLTTNILGLTMTLPMSNMERRGMFFQEKLVCREIGNVAGLLGFYIVSWDKIQFLPHMISHVFAGYYLSREESLLHRLKGRMLFYSNFRWK